MILIFLIGMLTGIMTVEIVDHIAPKDHKEVVEQTLKEDKL